MNQLCHCISSQVQGLKYENLNAQLEDGLICCLLMAIAYQRQH
jgi:hypothetical protein